MLIEDIADHIDQCLAQRPYYACVLLVHVELRTLEAATQQLAERTGWRMLPAGRTLAGILAARPPAWRSAAAGTALDGALAGLLPGPVLCTDLPLLFEPALALDPLALLRQWSRRLPLVAAWPGALTTQGLAYAVPEHAHYRLWRTTGLDRRCLLAL